MRALLRTRPSRLGFGLFTLSVFLTTLGLATATAQDTSAVFVPEIDHSGRLYGNSCDQASSWESASYELGCDYYYDGDYMFVSRAFLAFNTSVLDTDVVIDSVYLDFWTTSVSDPTDTMFFMMPDSMFDYPPAWNPYYWTLFDSMAAPWGTSGLSEESGPYRQVLKPEVVNPGGYTIIGMRMREDALQCGQAQGPRSHFVYLNMALAKKPQLIVKYRKKTKNCCITARVEPQEAADAGCQVIPSRAEGECGSQATLTAVEADGWNFTHWSGAASGSNSSATVTLQSQSPNCDEAVAHFVRPELTVSASGHEVHLCPCCGGERTHILATINLCANDVDDWVVHKIKLAARGTGHDVADLVQERLYVGEEKIATFWFSKDNDVVEVGVNRRVPKGGCLTLRVEYVFRDTISMAGVDTFKTFFVETRTDWVTAEPLNYSRYVKLPVGGQFRVGPGLVAPVWNVSRDKPFMKIQAAVDDAATQPGDTIGVCPGEIRENAVVAGKDRLVIRGMVFGQTSLVKGIDPRKPVIDIRADSTTVALLSLQQPNQVGPVLLARGVKGVRAEYLNVAYGGVGVHFANVDGGAIFGCTVRYNRYGAELDSCRNVVVGDTVAGRWGNRGNEFTENVYGGLYIRHSSSGRVLGNVALDNSGVEIASGIHLYDVGGFAVTRNICGNNEYAGIWLHSVRNTLLEGNLLGVSQGGNALPNLIGMEVSDSYDLAIRKNVISGNLKGEPYKFTVPKQGVGLHILETLTGSSNITIEGNRIGTSSDGLQAVPNYTGILLQGGVGPISIEKNVISGNELYGVFMGMTGEAAAAPEQVAMRDNFIGIGADGRSVLPNNWAGIEVSSATDVHIGPGNLVGACGGRPYYEESLLSPRWAPSRYGGITLGRLAQNVVVQGNRIGVTEDGSAVPNRVGIWIEQGSDHQVASNVIAFSKENAIYVKNARNCRIEDNEIRNNHSEAILIREGDGHIVRGNRVHDNRAAGLALQYVMHTKVVGNNFSRNCPGASALQCGVGVEFVGNTYQENCKSTGIHLDGTDGRIVGNRIVDDTGDGVFAENGAQPLLRDNWIAGNQGFGVRNLDPTVTVDAQHNWWGDASGPGGVGSGSGDEVSPYVSFANWLTAAPTMITAVLPDTLLIPVGGTDSLTCAVQNWQKPDDAVQYRVRVDSAQWCQSDTAGTVQLQAETGGAFTLRFNVPEGTTPGAMSRVEVVLASTSSPDLRDTVRAVVSTYAPGAVGIRVLPGVAYLTPGARLNFGAVSFDRAGRPSVAGVEWSASCGTIDSAGTYTAPDEPTECVVVAVEPNTGYRDTARVHVVPWIDSLAVSPRQATVQSGGQVQFQAVGYDSAKNPVAVQVRWFASGGQITADGLYTAGTVNDTARYWVAAVYPATGHTDTVWVAVSPATSADDAQPAAPLEFALYQNYPNPFNPVTTIAYSVRERCRVQLRVFDLLGQEVATLVDKVQEPGRYRIRFSAQGLPSGVYLVAIQMGPYRATRKMIVLK